jgi:hypothetical protein
MNGPRPRCMGGSSCVLLNGSCLGHGRSAMVQGLLLRRNLNLASQEGPRWGREILGSPWDWQATQDTSSRRRAKDRV